MKIKKYVFKILLIFVLVLALSFIKIFPDEVLRFSSSFKNAYAQNKSLDSLSKLDYDVLKSIQKREESLIKYEEEVKKREEQLVVLREDVEERLKRLEQIKGVLEKLVKTKEDLDEKSILHLVKVYETMKPTAAAPLIESLDRSLTIAILSRMKGKSVGKILSNVDPDIATLISEQIAKRKK